MNKFYLDELKRRGVLLEILRAFGLEIHQGFIKQAKINTDGHRQCNSNPTTIVEVKNEVGSTGTEPSLQLLLYYDTFIREYELWKDMSSIHPCFVFTHAGKPLSTLYFRLKKF